MPLEGTLKSVKAKWSCGGCGSEFVVDLEPAYKPPADWTIFDVALDTVRGESGPTVQGDYVLCPTCTSLVDNDPRIPEDRNATTEEVAMIIEDKLGGNRDHT